MQNQNNKKIYDMDDKPKGREGIEEMLRHLEESDENNNTDNLKSKETA